MHVAKWRKYRPWAYEYIAPLSYVLTQITMSNLIYNCSITAVVLLIYVLYHVWSPSACPIGEFPWPEEADLDLRRSMSPTGNRKEGTLPDLPAHRTMANNASCALQKKNKTSIPRKARKKETAVGAELLYNRRYTYWPWVQVIRWPCSPPWPEPWQDGGFLLYLDCSNQVNLLILCLCMGHSFELWPVDTIRTYVGTEERIMLCSRFIFAHRGVIWECIEFI